MTDPRRRIPRTDTLLADPRFLAARAYASDAVIRAAITSAQHQARALEITPEEVAKTALSAIPRGTSLTPVINATGVIVHTNIGRAPLSDAARDALHKAAGYVDVEMDLPAGVRARNRGAGARAALLAACPAAEDALIVNNGAAGLYLSTSALAAGGSLLVSRGELIEIGAGFRLPELIETADVTLKEVGATNRTHLHDYAVDETTRAILKVHPSNYRIEGFTSAVGVKELAEHAHAHGLPLIVDLGSGLLQHDPALPDEPDITAQLEAGADVVIASGDKLLGGPQAGLLLGTSAVIERLRRHPVARAVRVDKLTLAALEATVTGPDTPVSRYLHADGLQERTEALRKAVGAGDVVAHDGRVGGGGAPGFPLAGYALRLPAQWAKPLRTGEPAVLGQVHEGALLIDLRCVDPRDDAAVARAIKKVK